MSGHAEEQPEYAWLRELKDTRGDELRRRYGAHAIGIGRKRVGGHPTDRLALIFYVSKKRPDDPNAADAIPPTIRFKPTGATMQVDLLTDVRETAPAQNE
jgi:hypothetical protein